MINYSYQFKLEENHVHILISSEFPKSIDVLAWNWYEFGVICDTPVI